jgi:hypothetical protein
LIYNREKERRMTFLDRLEAGINPSDKFEFTLDEEQKSESNEHKNNDEPRLSQNSEKVKEKAKPSDD